jgi:two-component system chemotaxis sensor kinase CheA
MDVVKTSVERIGGTVDIQSRLGRGTKIHFKIPLTLAIVPALIVTCRGGRYAIPQVNLVELVRLEGPHAVEYVRDAPVHRLRGQLLPLTFLQSVLGGTAPGRNAGDLTMIVLRADNRTFGLVVDDVADSQEIVVKPLGRELSRVPIFAGATIMGDGKVALILDVFGIAERVGIDASERDADRSHEEPDPVASSGDSMLLFRLGGQRRMAIELERVDRLEEFPASALERVGSTSVIQYRGQVLRLLHVGEILGEPYPEPSGVIQVLVCSRAGQTVGLVVEQIADIVQQPAEIDRQVSREGVLGVAVLGGSVTEVLDVGAAWQVLEQRSLGPQRRLAS